jgi:hypothetical protein
MLRERGTPPSKEKDETQTRAELNFRLMHEQTLKKAHTRWICAERSKRPEVCCYELSHKLLLKYLWRIHAITSSSIPTTK